MYNYIVYLYIFLQHSAHKTLDGFLLVMAQRTWNQTRQCQIKTLEALVHSEK